jgi:hypothetical protein
MKRSGANCPPRNGNKARTIVRSPAEIAFRLKQETRNVLLRAFPPHLSERTDISGPLPFLPDPELVFRRLSGTPFALECERLAEGILRRRFPMLGLEICTEPRIRWRRDYLSGIETAPVYFRRIPYLDAARAGDHKVIWELNRHQHLVLLAQAYRFTGRREFLDDIPRQLENWFEDNPFQRGINWVSALEVAFRALSWIWVLHFAGNDFEPAFRFRFLTWLYRHGEHVATNLSVYFSPNTHLLGEAVALHALGLVFARTEWTDTGSRIVGEEILRQVRNDGSHFEQSSYYHLYALDMFLFEAVLSKPSASYRDKLTAMARFLDCLMSHGQIPFLGDDDGGRLFHPFGARNRFGAATLASCGVLLDRPDWIRDVSDLGIQAAWWLGEAARDRRPATETGRDSVRFPDSGIVVMTSGSARILCDAGSFGPGSGGHSHSDTLSVVADDASEELLIDPGTYTYVGDALLRDRFRGSAAHNTVRIDGRDQADPSGPFSWRNPPQVETVRWSANAEYDLLIALCKAFGITHKRSILMLKKESAAIIVDDIFEDDLHETKERLVEQFWHTGPLADRLSPHSFAIGSRATLTLWAKDRLGECDRSEGGEFGWRSPAPGRKNEAISLRLTRNGRLPVRLASVLDFRGDRIAGSLEIAGEYSWIYDGPRRITFDFEKR